MLWAGSVATIPSGWHLCDGTMGTPNLNSKFIFGAHGGLAPGTVGGTVEHTHPFTGDGHDHDLAAGLVIADSDPAGDFQHFTESSAVEGDTDLADHMPPFHALCYIMKL